MVKVLDTAGGLTVVLYVIPGGQGILLEFREPVQAQEYL